MCPSNIHQTNETSSGFPEGKGCQAGYISRQPLNSLQLSKGSPYPDGTYQGVFPALGLLINENRS